jgi:alpha-tubulin suppressor-like RCC1 family protein
LRRDRAIDVNGTALNTAIAIEIVQKDGTSFPNPVVINLPNAGVTVDNNGSRIQVSANVIPYNDADGHSTDQQRKFKVYNVIGNHIFSDAFNVNVQPSALSATGFTLAHAFNRHHVIGDDVTLTGTSLRSISEIRLVDALGVDLNGTPKLTLPHPGVTVTDASIFIDTSTAQFSNFANADSNKTSDWRRFKLLSARDSVMSPAEQRFYVGLIPTYGTLAGLTPGSLHYRRDNDVMTFNGQNLGIITKVEVVDINGNPIPGVQPITPTHGITRTAKDRFIVATDSFTQAHLIDSIVMDKRIRVHTPFGIATSAANGSGMFTVSATPVITGFIGAAWDASNQRYDASKGDLIIYGKNFRGINRLIFEGSDGSIFIDILVDPEALPLGMVMNAGGTLLSITPQFLETRGASWLRSADTQNRRVRATSAAIQQVVSPYAKTRDLQGNDTLGGVSLPTIDVQPQSATVALGASFTINVTVTGATGYQWYKNGVALFGATASSYTDVTAAEADAGAYTVIASNTGGAVESVTANIAVSTLVAYYPFNGNANDASGNGLNGTAENSSATTDINGTSSKAWNFVNNVNSRVTLPSNAALTFSDKFSTSFWVKFNQSWSSHGETLIWKHVAPSDDGFRVLVNQDGSYGAGNYKVYFQIGSASISIGKIMSYSDISKWFHIAAVYNQGSAQIYINGVLADTGSGGATMTDSNRIMYLGGSQNPVSGAYNRDIDEVRIYSNALTATEVATLFNQEKPVRDVSAGWRHSLFLRSDGSLWASGWNEKGQLGDSTTSDRTTPIRTVSNGVIAAAAGYYHSLYIDDNGALWAMGDNSKGQLGDGTIINRSTPVKILNSGVTAVAAGQYHSLFVKSDGSLWAMGNNANGQLGDGSTTQRNSPVQIVANGIQSVSAGQNHSLFLTTGNILKAMGGNTHGQLGDGSTTQRTSPVQIATTVTGLAAGGLHSHFIKSDGSLWSTGYNFYGQLGNGATSSLSTPVKVINSGVTQIRGGSEHSVFLKTGGSLWAMGANVHGQLGDASTTPRSTPIQIETGITAAAAGVDHSLLLKTDLTYWATGRNDYGQLGDTTTTGRLAPVEATVGP